MSGFLRLSAAGILGLFLVSPVRVQAQAPSLAEIAKKEQERRKALPSSTKVYTNDDLPKSAIRPETPAPQAPAEAGASQAPAEAAESQAAPATPAAPEQPKTEVRDEAWWKARIAEAREAIRRNEVFAEALQSRINALNRDFVNRDNPVQRRQIGEERAEALKELERVKQEIEAGKKQIADIEEEARKAGVPPGWLR